MPTQRGGYYTADKQRVPSVTTILSRFKESGGLIHWAWQKGVEGKDYREERDAAADAGTIAHQLVDDYIHGKEMVVPWTKAPAEVCSRAVTAFDAFRQWADQTKFTVTHTELPLVSEKHRFGGTFDAILVNGKRSMGDWKSSNALYPEMLCQVAAYAKLWEENYPEEPIDGGFTVLRFDKTYGDFHHHWWAELDAGWEAFLILRRLYDLDKELKARVK